ncbi:MAG: GDP-mannose 4,6-dehydratase [Planctomyces sp.]|nr:GDP-mannose 4,6-dehydratase [Planctomyces sp.]
MSKRSKKSASGSSNGAKAAAGSAAVRAGEGARGGAGAAASPKAKASGQPAGRRALITGVTGQDGSYLAELLIGKGYEVHGVIRRSSSFNTGRIDHIYLDPHVRGGRLRLHYGDLCDSNVLSKLMAQVRPHEVYNLGAQSHVRVSFDMPVYTAETVAMGALKLLEAVRDYQQASGEKVRYYQASSSEQYGKVVESPQRETTPFYPRSPYACAKVMAHWATVNYRESYGVHASCGVLFNHESPRRGETFVTRKITRAVGRIKTGLQEKVFLGNLDSRRDWGFAGDYVKMMWLMLQQETPDDYVIATGRCISVREFAQMAFEHAGLSWKKHVEFDPRYLRPAEVDLLLGDPGKAKKKLGWKPETSVEALAAMMVDHDLELARREKTLRDAGHELPDFAGHDQ